MTTTAKISYVLLALTLILAGLLKLGAPLLVAFFSYFALQKLFLVTKRKWLALILFILVVAGIASAGGHFMRVAVHALPEIAETSIPTASAWAQKRNLELPFSDLQGLGELLIDTAKERAQDFQNVAKVAGRTTTLLFFVLIAIVSAANLFLRNVTFEKANPAQNNLYVTLGNDVADRFSDFYSSFSTVLGAQILISTINTILTTIFVLVVQLPYAPLVIVVTFLCGLVPIVGNLVSNTIIVFVSLTVSINLAIGALVFLILVHKLEYFLNSKIIGYRIRNPVWLTLVGLVIGERLMGIPGMVLAPVVLNYIRVEMLKVKVSPASKPSSVELNSL